MLIIPSQFHRCAMMEVGSSSQSKKSNYLTQAKWCGTPIRNLLKSFDENSVTKTAPTLRIKNEKNEISG